MIQWLRLLHNRLYSDDGSLDKAPFIQEWIDRMDEATTKFGKRMSVAHEQKKLIEEAGFVKVEEELFKVRSTFTTPLGRHVLEGMSFLLMPLPGSLWCLAEGQKPQGDRPLPTRSPDRNRGACDNGNVFEGSRMADGKDQHLHGRDQKGAERPQVTSLCDFPLYMGSEARVRGDCD